MKNQHNKDNQWNKSQIRFDFKETEFIKFSPLTFNKRFSKQITLKFTYF